MLLLFGSSKNNDLRDREWEAILSSLSYFDKASDMKGAFTEK